MSNREDTSRSDTPLGQPEVVRGAFNTTHWSVVMLAGQETSPESSSALEHLCRTYWYPLYAYARRSERMPRSSACEAGLNILFAPSQ